MSIHSVQEVDFVLLDSYSLLFRAFYAFPLSLTSPDGKLTNAAFGFTKLLLDVLKKSQPKYLIAAVDMGKPTFRHEQFSDYKANREEAPHELTQQISLMHDVLKSLNIPTIGLIGYEADDVIGTLATSLRQTRPELNVGVFTGDRDSFQLVGESVYVMMPAHGRGGGIELVDTECVIDRLGVHPTQVVDYKALCGDASDNIPGVKGVGPKTASQLLHAFGSLQNIYTGVALASNHPEWLDVLRSDENLPTPDLENTWKESAQNLSAGVIKKLVEGQELAFLSRDLAQIDLAVPLDFNIEQSAVSEYDKQEVTRLFTELGFRSLMKDLPQDRFETAVQTSLF